jgi:hypothetical protein
MQAWIDEIFQRRRKELDSRWRGYCGMLLIEQAKAEGRRSKLGERIKGYVPEHRRAEEEERIRQELQELEKLRSRSKAR